MTIAALDRFWPKVDVGAHDECWLWQGAVGSHGYGNFFAEGEYVLAHRFIYEAVVGPIPAGLTIDHRCDTPLCENPNHLRPLTNGDNNARGNSLSARRKRQTRCLKGHPFNAHNTIIRPNGARTCRECRRASDRGRRDAAWWREYRRRRKAAVHG